MIVRFISFEIDPDEFSQRIICHGIIPFLAGDWYRDGLTDAPFGNISSILL